jgi:hypothetical protein
LKIVPRDFLESDWKVLRQLAPIALDRFCLRVLDEIERISADTSKTAHERYSQIHQLIDDRDRTLSRAFDDMRRSTAFLRLANICAAKLLTEDEMTRFSTKTRDAVALLVSPDS